MKEGIKTLKQQMEMERSLGESLAELSKAILSPINSSGDIYQLVLDKARDLTSSKYVGTGELE